ncbi:TrkA C-terminal domain-containing protein [Anaerocolumna sp.]|uniref:TrkA C-terminal domain-containing protein n=1 Tax=Anaerocolumna sp. TaxID=2041569 RepID=UPI0028A584DC|nr:TrkA C-terminal domain-containing protein [Anaerocolumna sp.]
MKNIGPPVYSQIALDIAVRIARGDLKENTKISGRSKMASEYNVSPETIRRSFQLLQDMKIIEVLQSSGAIIKSRDNALKYIERNNIGNDFRNLKRELNALLKERSNMDKRINEIVSQIIDYSERFRNIKPLYTLEFEIPENSSILKKSITETKFWQNTGATIVAIKRSDDIILSPGPYFVFEPHDIIVVTGDMGISQRIQDLIKNID